MTKKKTKEKKDNFIEKISKIRDRLKTELSGHVQAYRQLVSREDQAKLERLYSKESEEEWLKIIEKDKNDWIAAHHLAVMNHAKAFELEIEGKSKKAKEFWKKALKYWGKVLSSNQTIKGAEAGLIESTHNLVKEMQFYKAEDHKAKFEKLKDIIPFELLKVHQFFYHHYRRQKKIEKADIHYSIVEESQYGTIKNKIIMDIYENNYGERVNRLVNEIDKQTSEKLQLKFSEQIVELQEEIIELSNKRKSLYISSRDIVILISRDIQLKLTRMLFNLVEFDKTPDVERFLKLKEKLESSERGFGAGDSIIKHVQEFKTLNEKILKHLEEIYKELGYIKTLLRKSKTHITRLGQLNFSDKEKAIRAMKDAITKIQTYENRVEGINQRDDFNELLQISRELMKQIKSLDSFPDGMNHTLDDERDYFNIWELKEVSKEKIPYYDTCFLLLETEFPSMSRGVDLRKLIHKMNKKRDRLEAKADAGKHQVLDRKIAVVDLNRVHRRLRSPLDLVQDIILTHQAHHADPVAVKDIKTKLSEIDVPRPETVSLELSPGIFSLFSFLKTPGKTGLSWKNIEKESPREQPVIKIKWPT